MPRITLPDGSERSYDAPTSPAQVAADIGPGLAKAALGATINGKLADLARPIDADCELSLVTAKTREGEIDEQALFLLRHSAAHVMAEAITNLFPGVQLVYGPPVEQGFYYDMAFPDGSSISSEDFERIEAEMTRIVKEDRPFTRYEMPAGPRHRQTRGEGSKYKLDNATRGHRGRLQRTLLVRHRNPGHRLGGSLPRPPRSVHRSDRRVQGHEPRVELLAR